MALFSPMVMTDFCIMYDENSSSTFIRATRSPRTSFSFSANITHIKHCRCTGHQQDMILYKGWNIPKGLLCLKRHFNWAEIIYLLSKSSSHSHTKNAPPPENCDVAEGNFCATFALSHNFCHGAQPSCNFDWFWAVFLRFVCGLPTVVAK